MINDMNVAIKENVIEVDFAKLTIGNIIELNFTTMSKSDLLKIAQSNLGYSLNIVKHANNEENRAMALFYQNVVNGLKGKYKTRG